MYQDDADFTITFRSLSSVTSVDETLEELPAALAAAFETPLEPERASAWLQWLASYRATSRLPTPIFCLEHDNYVANNAAPLLRAEGRPDEERRAAQNAVNPKFIPRQHLLYGAYDACEKGDTSELESLMDVLRRPFDEQNDVDPKYSALPPEEITKKRGGALFSFIILLVSSTIKILAMGTCKWSSTAYCWRGRDVKLNGFTLLHLPVTWVPCNLDA
eukprot:352965-Chlamydomonas_euryale.AAC.9